MKILKIYNRLLFLIVIIISHIFPVDQFIHIKSITSLISPKNLIEINNNLLAVTNGGGFIYNPTFDSTTDYIDNFAYKNINTISKDQNSRFWIGGAFPNGVIQIMDSQLELNHLLDYANFDNIEKIVFTENFAFASCFYNNKYGIVKYSNTDNPNYLNFFDNFPYDNISINDIATYNDTLLIATNNGLLKGYTNSEFLLFSDSWITDYEGSFIDKIYIDYDDIYMIVDNDIIKNDNIIFNVENNSKILKIFKLLDEVYFLTNNNLFMLNNQNMLEDLFNLPSEFMCLDPCSEDSGFSDVVFLDSHFYFSIVNSGILKTDNNFNVIKNIIPNTIFKNDFNSIRYNDNNDILYGISKEGGFLLSNAKLINSNYYIRNFYPRNFDSNDENLLVNEYFKKYPEKISDIVSEYYGKYVNYISGEKDPLSIEFDNTENIFIPNSGIYPSINHSHYNAIIDSMENNGYSIDDIYFGSLYELNFFDLSIENVWGDEIFNGLGGITSNNSDGYTVINQIKFNQNELYVLNPYSENWYNDNLEHVNLPICIKNDTDDWIFIEDDEDFEAYIPTEVSIDPLNNIWIGYRSYEDHSPGGIRVVQQNNYDLWYNSGIIPELSGVNVWSLDFGIDINGNNILWVISDLGVMGYYVNLFLDESNILDIQIINISPYYYYSDIPFNINSKIRVDKQNNAWITSPGYGLKVIHSNGQLWPGNDGITQINSNLLSNQVNDIAFDNDGYVYIATDKGITILKTVFSSDDTSPKLSISPNPFIINENLGITISNIDKGSLIQIINLSGKVVKQFNLVYENSIINWDGRSDNGVLLNTGIYIITAYSNGEVKQGKLAIIN